MRYSNSPSATSFKTLTTFRSGGNARYVVECESEEEVREAVRFAKEHSLPWYVLGEGSNVLASDSGFEGVILRLVSERVEYSSQEDNIVVRACAGVSWDGFVKEVTKKGLWGVENLAGIPGTVGASPVQNIGAYGVELKDVFLSAQVYDADKDTTLVYTQEQCGFGYRESVFKHAPHLIILSVDMTLSKSADAKLLYKDVAKVASEGADLSTPEKVADVIRRIRKEKFPDLSTHGTAGSFFKNPIIATHIYKKLVEKYPGLPGYSAGDNVKMPLAYILDHVLSLRGYRHGNAWLYTKQPLVMVLDAGGTSEEVEMLAQDVEQKVCTATGIQIEREVRTL